MPGSSNKTVKPLEVHNNNTNSSTKSSGKKMDYGAAQNGMSNGGGGQFGGQQQKVTLRRRCRSECHQFVGGDEASDALNNFPAKTNHLLGQEMKHKGGGAMRNGFRAKYSPPRHMVASRKLLALTKETHAQNVIRELDGESEDHIKENISEYTLKGGRKDHGEAVTEQKIACGDLHKRRTRPRSESEPHEIYKTTNGIDKNRNDDMALKRSREEDSPPMHYQLKLSNGNHAVPAFPVEKKSPPASPRKVNGSCDVNYSSAKVTVMNGERQEAQKAAPTARDAVKDVEDSHSDMSDTECSSLDGDAMADFDEEDVYDLMSQSEDVDGDKMFSANISVAIQSKVNLPPIEAHQAIVAEPEVNFTSTAGPISPSMFPNVPPFLTFASDTDPGPQMHPLVTKILKWKVTAVTPIVVRKVLLNSGFRLLKQTNDWIGIWGKHMKSPQFRTIRSYQKFNHIPGTFQIGRKDRVWRNLQLQMARNGKKEFGFMPRTYILPQDLKTLRQMWPRYSQRGVKWIIKPPASARGTGIKVVNRWSQIPKRRPIIVQRYVERPMLIDGSKFDLRLYVLVTSMNPLKVYMHTDGLARFASVRYSEKVDTLNDRFMHLTNYSINKFSANYAKNEDAEACKGHKWTIKSLWSYLEAGGVDTERLWGALRNLVIRTLLAGETPIHNLTKSNMLCKYNCYELFGFDVLLDSDLVPWLLEVNISPSLHSSSPLDLHVKAPLVRATLNTALYQVPPKLAEDKQQEVAQSLNLQGSLCMDKRMYTTTLARSERIKHNHFTGRELNREDYLESILDNLTADDVRCLILVEEELTRCAPLERIFPAPNSHKYLNYMDNPRYYNRLLDAWETKYAGRREEGIARLQDLCAKKVHLQVSPASMKKANFSRISAMDSPLKCRKWSRKFPRFNATCLPKITGRRFCKNKTK
ncbi:tubulin monoglutamylase TTLL4 isoform X2 [Phlebotomus argentipes]|uniref:tubulin monoglutamylase TTLL4 isoform X2 n=1 Tax=Phlebotomus argentipes TaxID=94469 RepID=UPI002892B634|nr:tubulin monoglutamylase TTLL4 isoform X2 [Phlebotomus argentipes]